MFYRKDAVLMAVAGLLASSGFAMAAGTPTSNHLSLDPTTATADAAPDQAPLMMLLDKAGAAKPLSDLGLNVYGWVEAGYTYNHRHDGTPIAPGPFNHEFGNHFMLNQVDLRIERLVDTKKLDVGGMIEVMYGTDAARIHSTGMGFDGSDPSDNSDPADPLAVANLHPITQFDVTQAYLDVNLPVGNGLKLRIGKFVTLLGYETIDPRGNPFYSHSWIFSALPFTQTGVLGFYTLNDQWSFIAGVTRGWDQTMEDNGPQGGTGAVDGLGQIAYVVNKQITVLVNWSVGPQNFGDTSHYRTVIDPIVTWQVTDKLKLGLEGLYIYDGGMNGDAFGTPAVTHAYGDVWGAAVYAGYTVNDYVTVNGRFEKFHTYGNLGAVGSASVGDPTAATPVPGLGNVNVYSATLGVTITPLPKDPIGKNLSVRPEIRYDFSEDNIFSAGGNLWKDQLTFAADVIFKF